jgi:hypothetical protein
MVIAMLVVLALAAPAAADIPESVSNGWTWSSVVRVLTGLADGLWHAIAGSETEGDDDGADGDGDDQTVTSEPAPDSGSELHGEFDPNG